MHCQFCNQEFASKYTLRRHIGRKHRNMNETEMDDSMSDASDLSDSSQSSTDSYSNCKDIFSSMDLTSKTIDIENEEEYEDDDEQEGFWTLIIRETVENICHKRIVNGLPAHLSDLTDVSQLLEGKNLKNFIRRLKERYDEIREISSASNNDDLAMLLRKKSVKLSKKLHVDTNVEDCEEAIWKKYKFLIKKKIVENQEELKPLVESQDESGDEEQNELEE